MTQYSRNLDDIFQALTDSTRRAVLARLRAGPASITDLAEPFGMALPSFMKHIRQLEESGWIATRKVGRVRTCVLQKKALGMADAWLATQRAIWEARTDQLEQLVTGGVALTGKGERNRRKKA